MQRWVVIFSVFLALSHAFECPDGGQCKDGQTCCNDPVNGFECCPLDQGECCEDHDHCCPAGTLCDTVTSSCVNSTVSIPWIERTPAKAPTALRSFRMIKSNTGEDDDNICPDKSRCPAEFSCLRALTKYGCCPLAQGVPCSDGKHCCPEGHQCSEDCRSCVKKDIVTTVLCGDKTSECPDGTTCCETQTGEWGCCPMPKAVCCEDKQHCCPEGNTCDIEHEKCISPSTKKVTPMWAKFPARIRAEWEDRKDGEKVTAQTVPDEKPPVFTTEATVPPTKKEVSPSTVTHRPGGNNVPCNATAACPDGTTCCKNAQGEWACCPLPEAVCCADFIHCCPKGQKCNLAAGTCEDDTCSVPLVKKIPATTRHGVRVGNVPCDDTHACPDNCTCCKTTTGDWACCALPNAVCCDDHEHCCPAGTTCDVAAGTCVQGSTSTPMQPKIPALTTISSTPMLPTSRHVEVTTPLRTTPDEKPKVTTEKTKETTEGLAQCDGHTTCPQSTTCCFMKKQQKWGCCPLPEAVCCANGENCCPTNYKCDESQTSCVKGDVVIPWYTKIPATTNYPPETKAVRCDGQTQCPEHTTCCQLSTGLWGCCPLENAVCCQDKKHCCPKGYTCNLPSGSCQKLIMLQLDTVPLVPVYLPKPEPHLPPSEGNSVECEDHSLCEDGQTCCKMSETTWGCCPYPNAVCCSDRLHCCPSGFTCNAQGDCIQNMALSWQDWRMFSHNQKRAVIL